MVYGRSVRLVEIGTLLKTLSNKTVSNNTRQLLSVILELFHSLIETRTRNEHALCFEVRFKRHLLLDIVNKSIKLLLLFRE